MNANYIIDEWNKGCSKCKERYYSSMFAGLKDFFTTDPGHKDGLDTICKRCRASYREINKEKESLRYKRYYEKSKAVING